MGRRNAVLERLDRAVDVLVEGSGVASRRVALDLIRSAVKDLDPKTRQDESQDVLAFQKKFGHMFTTGQGQPLDEHPTLSRPRHMTKRKLMERARFLQEELDEFIKGCGCVAGPGDNRFEEDETLQDLAAQADALVDLVYVAKGTANLLGLPWPELWADVHRANMAKVPGKKVRAGVECMRDALKPEGWDPPHTDDILASVGYEEGAPLRPEWDDPEHCPGGSFTGDAS